MKRKIFSGAVIIFVWIGLVAADDIQTFIDTLNSRWTTRDYTGIKQAIDDRLAQKTNDLAALVAKADYFTSIELNFGNAQAANVQIKSVRDGLIWTNDPFAQVILNEMLRSIDNRQEAESAGYVFGLSSNQIEQAHSESPTNYPICIFLPRLSNVQYGGQ